MDITPWATNPHSKIDVGLLICSEYFTGLNPHYKIMNWVESIHLKSREFFHLRWEMFPYSYKQTPKLIIMNIFVICPWIDPQFFKVDGGIGYSVIPGHEIECKRRLPLHLQTSGYNYLQLFNVTCNFTYIKFITCI